jgi:RimJ/RimL family protein N-acetyltransferase
MLRGKKVILRPIKRSDKELFLRWLNDPEVIQFLVAYLPLAEGLEEKWIEETMVGQRPVFTIEAILKNGKTKPIGNCGFQEMSSKDRRGEFGIMIGEKDFWGSGYGLEATQLAISYGFYNLNLNKISSAAYAFNERSIKMHEKVGFKREGRRCEQIFKNGKYHDDIVFGLLRRDWIKKNKAG